MASGSVHSSSSRTSYGGACFWFESAEYTGDLRAALLGATLTTGFTAEKQ
jgi:hypothetical protein